jgi:hypothetical protein
MTLRQAKKIVFPAVDARRDIRNWRRANRYVRRALHRRSPMFPKSSYQECGVDHFVDDGAGMVPAGFMEWALWFEDFRARRVAHTTVGRCGVSTIGLGFDHGGGALYESATFTIDDDGRHHFDPCERYRTRKEALEGHQQLVAQLPPSEAS